MIKAYTGVGSRETPPEIMEAMRSIGYKLAMLGFILRSGAAPGADSAFEQGHDDYIESCNLVYLESKAAKQIFIPWEGFQNRSEREEGVYSNVPLPIKEMAMKMASEIHPAWDRCSQGAKTLHMRNCFQVLGKGLNNPSSFLICWAPMDNSGTPKGGTRTAWQLAVKNGVPCFNLANQEHLERIYTWL